MSRSTLREQPIWQQPTAYERWYDSSLGRCYSSSVAGTLSAWLAESPAACVLDAGCGPGLEMERLLAEAPQVIGMDCSFDMARRALVRTREDRHEREIIVGSVEAIPFADATFDLVFCVNCLEFVADRAAAFREIARVLRGSGTAILGVLNRRSVWELSRRLWRPFRNRPYYRGRFYTRDELTWNCLEAGLKIEEIRSVVHFPPIPPGPLAGVYNRFDRWSREHWSRWGGVLLTRARKAG